MKTMRNLVEGEFVLCEKDGEVTLQLQEQRIPWPHIGVKAWVEIPLTGDDPRILRLLAYYRRRAKRGEKP